MTQKKTKSKERVKRRKVKEGRGNRREKSSVMGGRSEEGKDTKAIDRL